MKINKYQQLTCNIRENTVVSPPQCFLKYSSRCNFLKPDQTFLVRYSRDPMWSHVVRWFTYFFIFVRVKVVNPWSWNFPEVSIAYVCVLDLVNNLDWNVLFFVSLVSCFLIVHQYDRVCSSPGTKSIPVWFCENWA